MQRKELVFSVQRPDAQMCVQDHISSAHVRPHRRKSKKSLPHATEEAYALAFHGLTAGCAPCREDSLRIKLATAMPIKTWQ